MTQQEQRIAIAEACGWKEEYVPIEGTLVTPLPNYPQDLNAMHEAEKNLIHYQKFMDNLFIIVSSQPERSTWGKVLLWDDCANMLKATASQRAEAFLKTIGRWKEV